MTADPRGWHLHDFGSGRTVVHNESGLYVAEFLNHSDAEHYLLLRSMAALEDIRYQRKTEPHPYTVDSYLHAVENARCVVCGGWRNAALHEEWLNQRDRDQRNYEAAEDRIAREEWSR